MASTLDEALYAYLVAVPDIATLVGTRIFPDYFSEAQALPAIAYSLEADRSVHTQQGASGLRHATYRLDAWATSLSSIMAIARELRTAMDGYKGLWDDVTIRACFLDSLGRSRDPDTEAYNVSLRFDVWYQWEDVPSPSVSPSASASATAS